MTEFPGRVPWADESGAFGAIALTPHFRAKVRGTGHDEAQLRVCCPGFKPVGLWLNPEFPIS